MRLEPQSIQQLGLVLPVLLDPDPEIQVDGGPQQGLDLSPSFLPHGLEHLAALSDHDALLRIALHHHERRHEDGATLTFGDILGSKSLPLLLIGVFLAGLALNLTPCVFPLIPITVGFFTQQTKDREGSTFPLALAYVVGIAVTYSVLGVLAALSCAIFGSALQSPWVVGLIVVVLLSLATSMFGLWELRVPGWAQRASGGRSGVFGALIMGLIIYKIGLPPVTYGAGLNLFSNPLLGFFLRHLGAYTVDRLKTAPIYRELLKEYTTLTLEFGLLSRNRRQSGLQKRP